LKNLTTGSDGPGVISYAWTRKVSSLAVGPGNC